MPETAGELQVPTVLGSGGGKQRPVARLTPAAWSDGGDAWVASTEGAELHALPAGATREGSSVRLPKSRYATMEAARAALGKLYPALKDAAANTDGTFNMYGAQLFSEGTWNNDPYTAADLHEMVRAHDLIGHELRPWAALGHDPAQTYAKSQGHPRVGSLANLRVAPNAEGKAALYGDMLNLPEPVYRAIEQKGYPTRSPEIYWNLNWPGQSQPLPRVLRAVSLLGTEEAGNPTLPDLFKAYDRQVDPDLDGELHTYDLSAEEIEDPAHESLNPDQPSGPDDPARLAVVKRAYAARAGTLIPGLPVRITHPAGTTRTGTDKAGRPWARVVKHDYGSVPGTLGADGDPADVYLSADPDPGAKVYTVRQHDAQTGAYDEDKHMLGFPGLIAARDAYLQEAHDPAMLGSVTAKPLSAFIAEMNRTRPKGNAGAETTQPAPPPTALGFAPDLQDAAANSGAKRSASAALARHRAQVASEARAALARAYSYDPSQPRDATGKWGSEGDQAAYHGLKALDESGSKLVDTGHKIVAHIALMRAFDKGHDHTKADAAQVKAKALIDDLNTKAEQADQSGNHDLAYRTYQAADHYDAALKGGLNTHHKNLSLPDYGSSLHAQIPTGQDAQDAFFKTSGILTAQVASGNNQHLTDALNAHNNAMSAAVDGEMGKAAHLSDKAEDEASKLAPGSLKASEKPRAAALMALLHPASFPAPLGHDATPSDVQNTIDANENHPATPFMSPEASTAMQTAHGHLMNAAVSIQNGHHADALDSLDKAKAELKTPEAAPLSNNAAGTFAPIGKSLVALHNSLKTQAQAIAPPAAPVPAAAPAPLVGVAPQLHDPTAALGDPKAQAWIEERRGKAAYHAQGALAALKAGDGTGYDHHMNALTAVRGVIAARRYDAGKAGNHAEEAALKAHENHIAGLSKSIKADFKAGSVSIGTQVMADQLGPVGNPHHAAAASAFTAATGKPAPKPAPVSAATTAANSLLANMKAATPPAAAPSAPAVPVKTIIGLSMVSHADVTHANPKPTGQGSNGATFYDAKDGTKHVVKTYAAPLQAYGEHIANTVYDALGVPVARTHLTDQPGGFASEVVPAGAKPVSVNNMTPDEAREFLKGYAADVVLGNRDVLGTGYVGGDVGGDNLLRGADGKIYRIDNGGSLLFYAAKGKKSTGSAHSLSELDGFSGTNMSYASLLQKAGYSDWREIPDIEEQMKRVGAALSDAHIDALTGAAPGVSDGERAEMKDCLTKRRDLLMSAASGIAADKAKAAAQKAKQASALKKLGPVIGAMPKLKRQSGPEIAAAFQAGQTPHNAAAQAYADTMGGHVKISGQGVQSVPKTAAAVAAAVQQAKAHGAGMHVWHYGGGTDDAATAARLSAIEPHMSFSHAAHQGDALDIIKSGFVGTTMHGLDGNAGDKGTATGKAKRRRIEEDALDIWHKDHGPDTAVPYGCLHPTAAAGEAGSYHNDGYGLVKLIAHPRVLKRSVYFQGDTWDHDKHTSAASRAHRAAAQGSMMNTAEAMTLHAKNGSDGTKIEAIPVGGMSMEDVHEIHAPDTKSADAVRQALDAAGHKHVSVYVGRTGKVATLHSARTVTHP